MHSDCWAQKNWVDGGRQISSPRARIQIRDKVGWVGRKGCGGGLLCRKILTGLWQQQQQREEGVLRGVHVDPVRALGGQFRLDVKRAFDYLGSKKEKSEEEQTVFLFVAQARRLLRFLIENDEAPNAGGSTASPRRPPGGQRFS